MTSYEQGFLTKCASAGVPKQAALAMLKQAAEPEADETALNTYFRNARWISSNIPTFDELAPDIPAWFKARGVDKPWGTEVTPGMFDRLVTRNGLGSPVLTQAGTNAVDNVVNVGDVGDGVQRSAPDPRIWESERVSRPISSRILHHLGLDEPPYINPPTLSKTPKNYKITRPNYDWFANLMANAAGQKADN